MKKLLALFVFTIAGFQQSSAQNIAYEVIRTEEAPGYFALRVYPGEDLPALEVETVFVENFTSKLGLNILYILSYLVELVIRFVQKLNQILLSVLITERFW